MGLEESRLGHTDLQLGPNLPKTYTFTARILSCILRGARTYNSILELGPSLPCRPYTLSWTVGIYDQGKYFLQF